MIWVDSKSQMQARQQNRIRYAIKKIDGVDADGTQSIFVLKILEKIEKTGLNLS